MTDAREPVISARRRRWNQFREFVFPLDALKFAAQSPMLLGAPRGDGRPVMLLPGYYASELSMRPLHGFLSHLGYAVSQWGLGRNMGDVATYTNQLAKHFDNQGGAPVTMIGWSLGGAISRRLARERPDLVHEVITMGTPVGGVPRDGVAGQRFSRDRDTDMDALEAQLHRRNLVPITQPLTVIYSESDGVVSSDIAIDHYNAHARHIKVNSTHMSMGVNAEIWRIIADTLASEA
ncbi:alpha/beta fold hydrolase [Parasphingorhabdus halotolerans]|uniref:Alpha/beta hydrolase n=1 Tax=Parasphingorhabdus halotolerans TaxID=2725558 RepID=A0A6H2DNV9_9SPHN|nr:alpha/beta hydrolase [Parasphingorhabdus halotolerans]QJB70352.1 alpha/beta hydrolase [Parasphingorhabdus halotolerans]